MERPAILKLRFVGWSELHRILAELATRVSETFAPEIVIAIAKGGYVPARLLMDFLGVEELGTVGAKFYKAPGTTKERPTITSVSLPPLAGLRALVVDDVIDSGRTIQLVVELLKSYGIRDLRTLSIFVKKWSPLLPDFYYEITDEWIVFPWELCETYRAIPSAASSYGTSAQLVERCVKKGLTASQ
ncbi:MAG: phosphoribosyltransferase [Desulfurococcaceae archaeon]